MMNAIFRNTSTALKLSITSFGCLASQQLQQSLLESGLAHSLLSWCQIYRPNTELTQTFRYTLDFFFVRWLRQPRVPIAASLCPAIADEADVCIRKCQAIETAFPVATYIEKGFQASPIHLLSSLETAASFAGGHPLPESGDTVS